MNNDDLQKEFLKRIALFILLKLAIYVGIAIAAKKARKAMED